MDRRSAIGGFGVGLAVGWNIASLGAIATRLSHAYGVGLATVGLFVTVQFVVHMAMQIPGGRIADRFGAQRSALVGLVVIAAGNAVSLIEPAVALAFVGRAIVGFGTGIAFVSGSDYIRARGGSRIHAGRLRQRVGARARHRARRRPARLGGFRAPYLTAIVVAALAFAALAVAPHAPRTLRHAGERIRGDLFRDRRLYHFGAIHALSFGFSVVVGNWVVTLLEHHGQSKGVAAAVGSLTLLLGFFTRIAGGSILSRPSASRWVAGEPRRWRRGRGRAGDCRSRWRDSSRRRRSSGSLPGSRSRWRSRVRRPRARTRPALRSASSTPGRRS